MKTSLNRKRRTTTIRKSTLVFGLLAPLISIFQVHGQNQINIVQDPHPNIGNVLRNINIEQDININVPKNLNINVIDNTSVAVQAQVLTYYGPNINVPKIVTAVALAKPKGRKLSVKPKKTTINKTLKKPVVSAYYKPKPTKNIKTTKPVIKRKIKPATIAAHTPSIIVQPSIAAAASGPVLAEPEAAVETPVVIHKNNTIQMALSPPVQSNVRSMESASKSMKHVSTMKLSDHKLKHKNSKHFRYSFNKKVMKFFAKTKKHKIDPAKCFVWK